MPYKNKKDRVKRGIEYRKENAEKIKEKKHQDYMLHSEEVKKRVKLWGENNPDKVKGYKLKWEKNNPEHGREYYLNNIDKIKEYEKKNKVRKDILLKDYRINYRLEHKAEEAERHRIYHQEHKEENRVYQNNKRKTDLKFNLSHKISGAILKSLKRNKNGYHWEDLVGYTLDDLKKHLENTMPKGYCWQDYMEGRLHVDHIIPNNAFNYNSVSHPDFKRCWDLTNLQLLPARENIRKSNKLYKPFQPALKLMIAGVI